MIYEYLAMRGAVVGKRKQSEPEQINIDGKRDRGIWSKYEKAVLVAHGAKKASQITGRSVRACEHQLYKFNKNWLANNE